MIKKKEKIKRLPLGDSLIFSFLVHFCNCVSGIDFHQNPFFFKKVIYLFLVVVGLCCCTGALSSCRERGRLFVVDHGLWRARAS